MRRSQFAALAREGFARLPETVRAKIKNVALLVEQEPSCALRKEVGLAGNETLLGFYRGIPRTARGQDYGVGPTLPDAIIIYQKPIEEEAVQNGLPSPSPQALCERIRKIVAETVWHEVGHYFGLNEAEVEQREKKRRIDSVAS